MQVAIIGGGICGLYLAWKLSEKGHKITVFERKKEIGQDICSGLFSERILEFIPQSRKLIKNRINSVFLHFPKKTIRVDFSKDFFVLPHFELDKLVAKLAQNQGAKLVLNHDVSEMPKGFDRIIGCDGANSFVKKSLGLSSPSFRIGFLRLIEKKDFSNYVEVWPCKTGFSWKIPGGENIEEGIIAKPKELSSLRILAPFKSRVVSQGLIIPKNSSITLCGDAAGLTKPWSGGGVIWGLKGAKLLLKTFPDFKKYRRSAKRFFLPKIIIAKIAVKLVCFLGFKMPWFLPKKSSIESDFLL